MLLCLCCPECDFRGCGWPTRQCPECRAELVGATFYVEPHDAPPLVPDMTEHRKRVPEATR
jgi:hypothetical protein